MDRRHPVQPEACLGVAPTVRDRHLVQYGDPTIENDAQVVYDCIVGFDPLVSPATGSKQKAQEAAVCEVTRGSNDYVRHREDPWFAVEGGEIVRMLAVAVQQRTGRHSRRRRVEEDNVGARDGQIGSYKCGASLLTVLGEQADLSTIC
jgi:hypothetical protein